MDHHARVLQQRIQVASLLGGGDEALEGIGSNQDEEQESQAHEAHDAQHSRDEALGQRAAEDGDREGPPGEHQRPEQDRAFVRAPGRGDAVVRGQLGVGVARDVEHREIVRVEGPCERGEGARDEDELPDRDRARGGEQRRASRARAGERQHHLRERERERDDQREVSQLGDHGPAFWPAKVPLSIGCPAFLNASAASGGM